MATNEYSQEQKSDLPRPELDEPRRTTESGVEDDSTPAPTSGGYGGVSEDEPPHHKIHTDDEPLPKPTSGTYDDDEGLSKDEEVFPTGSNSGYGGATEKPKSTEDYQDYRSSEPQSTVDESPEKRSVGFADSAPPASEPKSFGEEKSSGGFDDSAPPVSEPRSFGEEKSSGGYSDPSSAFPGAPIDRKVEEPGYGHETTSPTPTSDYTPEPTSTDPAALGSPTTPKKEGFMAKMMDKLPGHHKTSAAPETVEDYDSPTETGTPKKGLMTKIKEKLPGHHPTTPTTVE